MVSDDLGDADYLDRLPLSSQEQSCRDWQECPPSALIDHHLEPSKLGWQGLLLRRLGQAIVQAVAGDADRAGIVLHRKRGANRYQYQQRDDAVPHSAPSPSLVTNAPRLRLERDAVAVVQFQASALASECSRAPSVVHHEAYRELSLRRMTDRSGARRRQPSAVCCRCSCRPRAPSRGPRPTSAWPRGS